jgi:GT2 family glycosyltransferase
MSIAPVCVVTVTYGDRWPLLRQLLDAIERSPQIGEIIVVDNGAHRPIAPLVAAAGFSKARVHRQAANMGSAHGFKTGLELLRKQRTDWIWLLDDDNAPDAAALETLLRAAEALPVDERGLCAFLAFRPEHQSDIADGVAVRRCYPTQSSFFGFHVADIPYKIWRRLPWGHPSNRVAIPSQVVLPYAPYSGLFFHGDLLSRIGTPNAELVLYADDTEFSYRITSAGGRIQLLTDARLNELEPSWNAKRKTHSSFELWLTTGSDLRVFYSSRNQAYFDAKFWRRNRILYVLNREVFLAMLRFFAWRYDSRERYALVRRAIRLGESGRLGLAQDMPLP